MATESPPSPHSGGKHRRSPDDGDESALEEDASKRRKRHHHHRRRHGKHSVDEDEEMESAEASTPSDAPPAFLPPPSVSVEKHVDDEREEGEILDDDEGDGPDDGGRGVGRRSDAASGEIAARTVGDSFPDPMFTEEEDNLTCGRTKIFTPIESELGADGMVESGPTIEKSGTTDSPNGVAHTSRTRNKAYRVENNGISLRKETMDRQSKSPERAADKEKKHRRGDRNDSKRQGGSRSPVFDEYSYAIKHLRKDDKESRDLTHSLESESRRHLQSMDANVRALDKKKRSASPRSSRDRYNPSSSSQHRESRHRDQSWSHDSPRHRSYEKGSEASGDGSRPAVPVYPLDSLRNDDRSDKLDGYANKSETSDRGRERSSSYNRHDERHQSRERDWERERERRKISIRDRDNMEIDRGAHGEREINSYSRHERRDDRRQSRERGREQERDLYHGSTRGSHRDRSRDTSADKYKERERSKDRDHRRGRDGSDTDMNRSRERERSKDSDHRRGRDVSDTNRNRAREREASVQRGREEREQLERDQNSSRDRHRDSRNSNYDDAERRKDKRKSKELSSEVGSGRGHTAGTREQSIREEDVEDYEEKIEQQLVKQDEEDIDKIKEESRKRRQAILEKYKQRQQQEQEQQQLFESSSDGNKKDDEASLEENLQRPNTDPNNEAVKGEVQNEQENVDVYVADPSFIVNKSPLENGAYPSKKESTDHGLGEGSPKSEKSADMFTDIFGESPAAVRKMGKGDGPKLERNFLHDNWDDAEGYYSYRFGEVLDGRYEVISAHGKGVFSTVVRAKDLKAGRGDPEEVAIKIIRNNETMYKAGRDELVILKKLAGADPEDKRHCVRFLSSFKYRNHLCLVFESLHMNLREVLKKFGRNIGLKLTAVRAYAKQLFIALKHLRNCGVLHCDIKPDNMLVNESKNVLKLCDFGNAMFAGKNEITPYLVSRFYRAPEIILGLAYDHPMDIWSVGCCLYELYTGKVLFPGPSNNDMLRLHMELKGPFPKKMLRKGAFVDHHFDQDLNFHATEEDPVSKKAVKRLLLNIKPKDITALISGSPGEDPKMLANFKDLLEQIFILDPEKRMTVHQALSHPFITGK